MLDCVFLDGQNHISPKCLRMKFIGHFVLLNCLSFAYSKTAKVLLCWLVGLSLGNRECLLFRICHSPTSLLAVFITFTGVCVALVHLGQEGSSSDIMLFVLWGKGLAHQGHGPVLPVHLA